MQKSLGLIETQGLAGGIEAADAAVKSANVELIGYELTKGGGWTTVKIQGDIGAVKAAVDAARIAAGKVNRVVSTRVIPRPAEGLERLIRNGDTVGYIPPEPPKEPGPPAPPEPPKEPESPVVPDEPAEEEAAPAPEAEQPVMPEPAAEAVELGPTPEAPAEEPAPEAAAEETVTEPEPAVEAPAEEAASGEEAPAKPKTARKAPAKKGGKRSNNAKQ